MSCERTRAVLDKKKIAVGEERSSKKAPLSETDVKAMLASVERVIVSKGKNSRTLAAKETTLDDLRGPTGNFRAPMVRKGKTLLVGFSEGELERMITGAK